ncbi:MAG TPA: class I SAM-dependent methyltransferase [Pseudonocardia sp.]|jgi:SAM-dependent methyltransferase|nr:class I SAM-dependent methyltransferase [Pseudonocardia sp.]
MSEYAMGRNATERDRLGIQDRVLSPHSANLFRQAGVKPGDRVLDAGCGTGETTRLLAAIVGPTGSLIGVDNDPASLRAAEARAHDDGLTNVRYVEQDLIDLVLDGTVDCLVGRIVLLHVADPVSVLAGLVQWVRPGGLVAFQDISCSRVRGVPRLPALADWVSWMFTLGRYAGLDPDIGEHLPGIFAEAGLAGVNAVAVSPIGDCDSLIPRYLAATLESVSRLAIASGAAARHELDRFPGVLRQQARERNAMLYAQELTSAWARVPETPGGLRPGL